MDNNKFQEESTEHVATNGSKGGKSMFAIVLCSIAILLVITFVVIKVVQNSKPKYRIVNQVQTTQSAPKPSVEKKDTQSKNNDMAKKKEAASTGEELVYSVATDGFVNVRQFPDADSYVVGVLATNRKGAKLVSNQGKWWKVRIDNIEGYVNSKYVKFSSTPVKISGLPTVYYVVMRSYDTMEDAQMFNRMCADGAERWIYKCTSNGKTAYRLCDGCFSTRSDAQDRINECRSLYDGNNNWDDYTNAWIWESEGLGNCVYCPPIYEEVVEGIGDFPPLTPTGSTKQAIMWGE